MRMKLAVVIAAICGVGLLVAGASRAAQTGGLTSISAGHVTALRGAAKATTDGMQQGDRAMDSMPSSDSDQMGRQDDPTTGGRSGSLATLTAQPGGPTGMQHKSKVAPVELRPMPAGTVDLSLDPATGQLTARLNMFGLTPGSTHRIALFVNRDGGQPAFTFPDVTAAAGGQVVRTVRGRGTARLPADLFFQIDQGPSRFGDSPQTAEIAVAHERVRSLAAHHVTLRFESTQAQPYSQLSGKATLAYDARAQRLTVSLRVSGLAPGSHHAVHIHSGTCQVQGAVLHGLPDLVARDDGTAIETVSIDGVTTAPPAQGWYVNVHQGDMNHIETNMGPTVQYQPLVCGNVAS